MMEFEEEISDLQHLRELRPFDASSGYALKVTDSLNNVARRFNELCIRHHTTIGYKLSGAGVWRAIKRSLSSSVGSVPVTTST